MHGPLGLLKFVPILGNFLNPGGGDAVAQTITVNVDPVAGVNLSFPASFRWGVAHAGFQAEVAPAHPSIPTPTGTSGCTTRSTSCWESPTACRRTGRAPTSPTTATRSWPASSAHERLPDERRVEPYFPELDGRGGHLGRRWDRQRGRPESAGPAGQSGRGTALPCRVRVSRATPEPLVTVNHFTLPTWVHDPPTARPLIQLGLPAPAAEMAVADDPGRVRKVRRLPRVEIRRPGRQLGDTQRAIPRC